eukprot:TRINITY_DN21258_c0_g1_i4.p2 TRINITY_DN21258_c0_g1~~TRINITY_DN21258_c0_g1_i4.p2  ORF type:complete len:139 (-),score=11.68 TRINITY_DN21258_c0_g1_i4:500-916(-)
MQALGGIWHSYCCDCPDEVRSNKTSQVQLKLNAHPRRATWVAQFLLPVFQCPKLHSALIGRGASAGRVDLGASSEQLRTFYSSGVYPKSDVYAITGFLTRVARIVRQTRPLVASDWEWELKEHPQQLPKWVQDSVHMQ